MFDLTEKSKYLSYLLRHRPEAANLTLDREGWCEIEQLLVNTKMSLEEVLEIVRTDAKHRYSVKPSDWAVPTHIRANQGHSTDTVRLTFKQAVPPTVLYHGSTSSSAPMIMHTGLKPMKRHHVHLSADIDTAQSVGGRRKGDVVLFKVDAKQMMADGIKFYLSTNGVWLVDAVPPKYLQLDTP